jgi:hypothetical protein
MNNRCKKMKCRVLMLLTPLIGRPQFPVINLNGARKFVRKLIKDYKQKKEIHLK